MKKSVRFSLTLGNISPYFFSADLIAVLHSNSTLLNVGLSLSHIQGIQKSRIQQTVGYGTYCYLPNSMGTAIYISCHWYGYLYYFYGVQFSKEKGLYFTHIDRFMPDIHHFIDEFYYYECSSKADCLKHLLNDKYWNGKSFYEIESQFIWVDG